MNELFKLFLQSAQKVFRIFLKLNKIMCYIVFYLIIQHMFSKICFIHVYNISHNEITIFLMFIIIIPSPQINADEEYPNSAINSFYRNYSLPLNYVCYFHATSVYLNIQRKYTIKIC